MADPPPHWQDLAGLTDEQLVLRACQQNDRATFDMVIHRNDWLTAFCASRVYNSSNTHDVTQEAWLKAWQHCCEFYDTGPASFKRWLVTIANRTCISLNRGATRRRKHEQQAAQQRPELVPDDPLAGLHEERRDALRECIEELPPLQRCVVLATLAGAKPGDAAPQCGCTPAQASTALYQAKRTLKACTEAKGV